MARLEGRAAIVTGGAKGIGRHYAAALAAEGARVMIADIVDGAGVAAEIAARHGANSVAAEICDVSDEGAVRRLIDATLARFGKIDVLVNNAGISGANKPTHELTEAEWDQVQAINVKGVFFCTKHVIPHMKRGGGGSIINMSSIYGLIGAGDLPPYHASKGAVRLMSKTDAMIYAPDKIRVNSVHPGFIWTPMVQNFIDAQADPETARKATDAAHPLGSMGEPDDIAWGVVYLASDEAKFITGAELVIDGGYTAR